MDPSMFQQPPCSVTVHRIEHCIMMYTRGRTTRLSLQAFVMQSKSGHTKAGLALIDQAFSRQGG